MSSGRGLCRRMPAVAGLAVVLAVGMAHGASAAVVGIERVGAASASNSQNKSATVACPAGKQVLGAGGDVTPGNGDVLIDDVRPSADLRPHERDGQRARGRDQDWSVTAFAICVSY